ncbi:hypothetical protein [Motiliproteus sp. SC1-56]|uniref:hypothetical protein n=1 Tax=Motiliproteus sp. SC1-56 TaxID=2799565 RepID=UPI001A8DDF6E|nr:hypothetical protein [Motiliproteus sp. SC1-56]
MLNRELLVSVWLLLLAVTLISALLADVSASGAVPVLLVCAAAAIKGKLVVEYLVGLAGVKGAIRRSMLAYFYVLAPLIALGWLFPEVVIRLTSL